MTQEDTDAWMSPGPEGQEVRSVQRALAQRLANDLRRTIPIFAQNGEPLESCAPRVPDAVPGE